MQLITTDFNNDNEKGTKIIYNQETLKKIMDFIKNLCHTVERPQKIVLNVTQHAHMILQAGESKKTRAAPPQRIAMTATR